MTNNTGCFIYAGVKKINNASFIGIVGFEGIPQNFTINLIFWFILHILFIILRKKAWNYGRMAVVQKDELKWTDMFFAETGTELDKNSNTSITSSSARPIVVASNTSENVADGLPHMEPTSREIINKADLESNTNLNRIQASSYGPEGKLHINEIKDKGYFSWIKIVLTLTDKDYREKCGPDCVYYLSFQRHLILLAGIITTCSLIVILPLNLHRTLTGEVLGPNNKKKAVEFSDTTIINLGSKFEFLWFHIAFSMLFLFLSVFVMRHFSKTLKIADDEGSDYRTVSIVGLNKKKCDEAILRAHLEETYPGTEIVEISFAYDISKLQDLEFQRLKATSAKVYFQQAHEKRKLTDANRQKMRPYFCGATKCSACFGCCCKKTDAIDYYTKCEARLMKQLEVEREIALSKPLGIVYVTFRHIESAENIVEDYACSARLFLKAPVSKYTRELHSNRWIVKYAPEPEDIYWENLTTDYKFWYSKFILVNIVVAALVVLYSTPVAAVNFFVPSSISMQRPRVTNFNNATQTQGGIKHYIVNGIILDTLPTLLLWIMSVSLIALVSKSDYVCIGFWTKTAGNLSEMIKTFVFLTIMIIVLPSLGIKSFQVAFEQKHTIAWSCIFYKDNGAFFVNYVCTSSLAGTAAELMRLPELFVYAIKLQLAKSEAETAAIRKSLLWDFQIGIAYAWTMLHFALFTCFSVIYPLVTPFGLIYLILKHFTDRYNIYFAYAPCKVDKEVHATAVNFVIMSMFMLQLNLLAYVHFHIGDNQYHDSNLGAATDSKIRALQICSLLEFSVTAAFFLGQCCFNICADLSPLGSMRKSEVYENDDLENEEKNRKGSNLSEDSKLFGSAQDEEFTGSVGHSQGNLPNRFGRYVSPLLRREIIKHEEKLETKIDLPEEITEEIQANKRPSKQEWRKSADTKLQNTTDNDVLKSPKPNRKDKDKENKT